MKWVRVYWYPMAHSRVDERLALVADEHRRVVLEYLRHGRRRHASVDELAERLRTHQDSGEERRSVGAGRPRVDLVHVTLPRLEANGVVDWDRRHDEVRYRADEVVETVLDALSEEPVAVER